MLGIVGLEPPTPSADLREQLGFLRERVGVGLELREAVQEAGAACRSAESSSAAPIRRSRVQPRPRVAPQGGAPLRAGDRLVVDGEQMGDRG